MKYNWVYISFVLYWIKDDISGIEFTVETRISLFVKPKQFVTPKKGKNFKNFSVNILFK